MKRVAGRVGLALMLALALMLGAACTFSDVDPDADVRVATRVTRQDGAAASGRPVVLVKEPGPVEAIGGFFIAASTLGLACLATDPPPPCREAGRRATPGGDGSVGFEMKGRDTQSFARTASTFSLSSGLNPGPRELDGPAATQKFLIQTERLDLPDLRVWQPPVDLVAEGREGSLRWTPLPAPGFGTSSGYEVVFELGSGAAVWTAAAPASPFRFDPRVLEDTSGAASVFARAKAQATGTAIDLIFRSATIPYASTAGAPASRGQRCYAYNRVGQPIQQAPCRLTDGNLEQSFEPDTEPPCPPDRPSEPACQEPAHNAALLDLGTPRRMELVVVRGCESSCFVEASSDLRTWTALGVLTSYAASVAPDSPPSARYLRVRSETAGLFGLREVSIWDGPPAATVPDPLVRRVDVGAVPGARRITAPVDDRGRVLPAALAATLLLLVVVAALGATWAHRPHHEGPP